MAGLQQRRTGRVSLAVQTRNLTAGHEGLAAVDLQMGGSSDHHPTTDELEQRSPPFLLICVHEARSLLPKDYDTNSSDP